MSIAQLEKRELILFDLDGTLVDSAHDLYRAMNMSLNVLQLPLVTEEQVRTWIGKGRRYSVKVYSSIWWVKSHRHSIRNS